MNELTKSTSSLTPAERADLQEKVNSGKGITREELARIINAEEDINYKKLLLGIIQLGTQFGGFMGGMSSDKLCLINSELTKSTQGIVVAKFFTLGCQMARMETPESRAMDGYYG